MAEKKRRLPFGFGRAKKRAEEAAASPEKAERIVEDALKKADRQRGRLAEVWDELQGLLRLVHAWARREYRAIPWESLVLALGATIYFLNPVDVIPDFIAGLGLVDDIGVIAWVVQSIRRDIKEFLAWERATQEARRAVQADEPGGDGEDATPP